MTDKDYHYFQLNKIFQKMSIPEYLFLKASKMIENQDIICDSIDMFDYRDGEGKHYSGLKCKVIIKDDTTENKQTAEFMVGKDFCWQGVCQGRRCYCSFDYDDMRYDAKNKTRKLKPLAIMFSEYYFYLAAFIDSDKVRENFNVLNDAFPTIYRIDRLQGLKVLDEKFYVPYKDRFEEGEFRKRIQFMYGGKLRRVRFKYTGYSVEAVLDRLPTADAVKQGDGTYIVTAEVFGDGIDMWLRSQGKNIELL